MVLEHASLTDFCGIPLVSLRENSITELFLKQRGVGVPGAIVLSKLLPSAVALKSLKCAAATQSVCFCVSVRCHSAHLSFGSVDGCALPIDELKGNSTLRVLE